MSGVDTAYATVVLASAWPEVNSPPLRRSVHACKIEPLVRPQCISQATVKEPLCVRGEPAELGRLFGFTEAFALRRAVAATMPIRSVCRRLARSRSK
jgi:hypothetical protein